MLMARKNEATWRSQNTLIKFNEQIASKYRAGLSLHLNDYLEGKVVTKSIRQFYSKKQEK
jgi:hypothetical protein